jgi:hypothetical protein
MKSQDAKEYIEDCRKPDKTLDEQELIDLVIWAYDKGWSEGIADYREEQDPTECQEWRESR